MALELNEKYLLNRESWNEYLSLSKTNPALMMRASINYLQNATRGELDFVDVTTPAALLMEFSASLAANNFSYFKQADKNHYPALATKLDELYHHMSDELYDARFASPGKATFRFAFIRQEVIAHAVYPEGNGSIRELYIPRGTFISYEGLTFTLLHGIRIRVSASDGIDVIYDTTNLDETETLESNILEYSFSYGIDGTDYLFIDVPMLQINKELHDGGLTHEGNVLVNIVDYPDQFMKARVYITKDGLKREIYTTHSDLVYDPTRITARLKVTDNNKLRVDIPLTYYNQEKITAENVDIEVYTTRGNSNIDLLSISDDVKLVRDFTAYDLSPEKSRHHAPLSLMSWDIYPISGLSGGKDVTGFEQIKEWVIGGGREIRRNAITNANLKLNANVAGFDLITNVDYVTSRVYKGVREVEPDSEDKNFTRGLSCAIESVHIIPKELKQHPAVNVHEDRFTLTPNALYRTANGQTYIMNVADIPTIGNSSIDQFISRINTMEYVKTPFYYVFDNSGKQFELRAYHLDKPKFLAKSFIRRDEKSEYVVNSDFVNVERTSNGYRIVVISRSDDKYKEIPFEKLFCQLAFVPENMNSWVYLNGNFLGWEDTNHVWEFNINTTMDVNNEDCLILNNFRNLSRETSNYPIKLFAKMRLIFGGYDLGEDNVNLNDPIHERANVNILKPGTEIQVINENEIKVKFGSALDKLWKNHRSIVGERKFKRHEEDVPLRYTEDVFETDSSGFPIYTEGSDGTWNFKVKYEKGSEYKDENGEVIYLHRKGDVVLNDENQPVLDVPETIEQVIDLFMLDGIYYFSNYESDLNYIDKVVEKVTNWVNNEIEDLNKDLLEQTDLYFVPKRTMGYVKVLVDHGIEKTIFNRLGISVKYYLTNQGFNNVAFKDQLEIETRRVISDALKEKVISKDVIESRLREIGDLGYIHGVEILDLGLGENINTFTILDDDSSCSLRRKITLDANSKLRVKEDIVIEFVNHTKGVKL